MGIPGPGLPLWQFAPRQRLDLVQRAEECQCLQRQPALLLLRTVGFVKLASCVRCATQVGDAFDRAPGAVAIAHERTVPARQEGLRMLLATSWLVVEQHDRTVAVGGAAVHP